MVCRLFRSRWFEVSLLVIVCTLWCGWWSAGCSGRAGLRRRYWLSCAHRVTWLMVCRLFRSCWFEASLLVIVCASCDVADGLQVVPVALVRGVVTGYRVHIVDHSRSWKLQLNVTNKPFLRVRHLSTASDYVNLAVDARTSVGYNDSLHLDVVHVRHVTRGWYWLSVCFMQWTFSLSSWSVACRVVSLFLPHMSHFKSNLHQTLQTCRHCSAEELITVWKWFKYFSDGFFNSILQTVYNFSLMGLQQELFIGNDITFHQTVTK